MLPKTTRQYAGDNSEKFWDRVAALTGEDHNTLYGLGCDLQNLECEVLLQLEQAEARQAKTVV